MEYLLNKRTNSPSPVKKTRGELIASNFEKQVQAIILTENNAAYSRTILLIKNVYSRVLWQFTTKKTV